ncbi:hypothetical protein F4802DRAFT_425333 [Xylaria palmicola]|nr:hypothetical protein F4802DRAFT_425333 [Xylaria palmicola]
MRSLRKRAGCIGLLVSVMFAQSASATRDGDGEYEVHWVDKSHNVFRHVKRKDVCQLDGWSLCPTSVGGGCCPDNFECDTASCYATTAGPSTCHGTVGYYACPLTAGPGACCPVGKVCADIGCVDPPGVTVSQSCPASWFGCAASFGGGCCRDGQACGSGVCYNTTPRTLPVSETRTTTDSRGHTITAVVTSMAVITDGPNTSAGSTAAAAVVPQLIPSTVSKMDAIQTNDGSGGGGGGLSSGALGGIVAGVVVVLIVVVIAATLVILRLRRAERAARDAAESKREPSSSQPRSSPKSGFGRPSVSEIDSATDVDPRRRFPIMLPSPVRAATRSRSATTVTAVSDGRSAASTSPPLWGTLFGYPASVAPSDGRQSSLDSYHPRHDNNGGGSPAARTSQQRVSMDSAGTRGHERHPSDTSELEGPHGVSEIYTRGDGEAADTAGRRSGSLTRLVKAHVRRNSDLSVQNRARGDSSSGPGALGTVNEILELHGHYGPAHTASGQTAARLDQSPTSTKGAWDA